MDWRLATTILSVFGIVGLSWYLWYLYYYQPVCEDLSTQEECEANGCYWYDNSCHSEPYQPPPPENVYISGKVADLQNNLISNASITFNNASTNTNENGEYILSLQPDVSGVLSCSANGYVTETMNITTPSEGTLNVNFVLTSESQPPPPDTGFLNIHTTPVSGSIYIDGEYFGEGTVNTTLNVGTYNISFGDVTGYQTPESRMTEVIKDESVNVIGTYIETGPEPPSGTLELENEYLISRVESVSSSNNRIFASFGDMFRIIDISDISSPSITSEIRNAGIPIYGGPQIAHYISSENNAVIVTQRYSGRGAIFIDASTANYTRIQYQDGIATSSCIHNGIGFVSVGNYIYVYDLSNPSNPQQINLLDLGSDVGNIVCNNNILSTNSGGTARIYQINQDNTLTHISTITVGETIYDILRDNNLVFLSTMYSMRIYDISNPSSPVLLSTYSTTYYNKLAKVGNYLAVGVSSNEIEVLDISNASNPVKVSGITGEGYVRDLSPIDDTHIAVANSYNGVTIYEVSQTGSISKLSQIPSHGSFFSAIYENGKVFAIDDFGFLGLDFTQIPANEYFYDSYRGRGWLCRKAGNLIHCGCTWSGYQVYDVSNPDNPVHVIDFNPAEYITELDADLNYSYLGTSSATLWIYDISNPSSITQVSSISTGSDPSGIRIVGNRLYVSAGTSGFYVFDVTNKANPIELGHISDGYRYMKVDVMGNYAYVADYSSGLHIFDISNGTPNKVNLISIPSISYNGVVAKNQRVYVEGQLEAGYSDRGLYIFNATDPINLTLLEKMWIPDGEWADFKVYDDYVLMPRGAWGVRLYRFTESQPPPPPECPDYTNQTDCEANGCYWYDNSCHSEPYQPPPPETGFIEVTTTPVNGEIFVDGSSQGTSPINVEVSPGTYTISFGDVSGYTTPSEQLVTVLENDIVNIFAEYTEIITSDVTISGVVTDSATGTNIGNAVIRFATYQTMTNYYGQYTLTVAQGTYGTIEISKEGYETQYMEYTANENAMINVALVPISGSPTGDVTISGTITDSVTGANLGNVLVKFAGYQDQTDYYGQYDIVCPPGTSGTFEFIQTGYVTQTYSYTAPTGQNVTWDIQLVPI